MELFRLAVLKKRLVEGKDFSKIWDYFMTNFGENHEFMRMGETTRSAFLEFLVTETARGHFGKTAAVTGVMMIRIPEHNFVHSGLQVNGNFGNMFYFEDLGIGLLAVTNPTGRHDFLRFTARTQGGRLTRN